MQFDLEKGDPKWHIFYALMFKHFHYIAPLKNTPLPPDLISLADAVGRGEDPALVHQHSPAPVTDVAHNRVPELDGNLKHKNTFRFLYKINKNSRMEIWDMVRGNECPEWQSGWHAPEYKRWSEEMPDTRKCGHETQVWTWDTWDTKSRPWELLLFVINSK